MPMLILMGLGSVMVGIAIFTGQRSHAPILEFASTRSGTPRIYLMDASHPRLLMIQSDERFVPSSNYLCPNLNQWNGIATYEAYPYTVNFQPIFPILSPDGTQIVFESAYDGNFDIYLADVNSTQVFNLTDNDGYHVCPMWSPDGTALLFLSRDERNFDIMHLDLATGEQTNLTHHEGTDSDFAWSPDGSRIAFSSFRDGDGELFVMDADGGNLHRLTSTLGSDFSPVWSPDGTHIAFSSRRSGNPDIYIINALGGETQRLTNDPDNDFAPRWLK